MVKIKIIEIHCAEGYDSYGDCQYSKQVADWSDWDEVTEDEFKDLVKWTNEENSRYNQHIKFVIASPSQISAKLTVKEYRDRLKQKENEKKIRLKAASDKRAKQAATIAKRKKEKELKLLKELQSKYVKS